MIKSRELSLAHFKEIRKLQQKKYRQSNRKCLVEGFRAVRQICENGIIPDELITSKENLGKVKDLKCGILSTAERSFLNRLSGTQSPQDLIAVVPTRIIPVQKCDFLVYLDGVSDPGNLGAIFRIAAAAGIAGLVLSEDSCEIFNPKVIRASLGTVFSVPVEYRSREWIISQDCKIISSVREKGDNLFETDFGPEDKILVIGSEAEGISSEIIRRSDQLLMIPQTEKIESLNAAVAAGILIFQIKYSP